MRLTTASPGSRIRSASRIPSSRTLVLRRLKAAALEILKLCGTGGLIVRTGPIRPNRRRPDTRVTKEETSMNHYRLPWSGWLTSRVLIGIMIGVSIPVAAQSSTG
jgi:hypothetical protein